MDDIIKEMERWLEQLAESQEDEALTKSEEANRYENLVSWRYDEDPDPVEAMG